MRAYGRNLFSGSALEKKVVKDFRKGMTPADIPLIALGKLDAISSAARSMVIDHGIAPDHAQKMVSGIVRSKMNYTRDRKM